MTGDKRDQMQKWECRLHLKSCIVELPKNYQFKGMFTVANVKDQVQKVVNSNNVLPVKARDKLFRTFKWEWCSFRRNKFAANAKVEGKYLQSSVHRAEVND